MYYLLVMVWACCLASLLPGESASHSAGRNVLWGGGCQEGCGTTAAARESGVQPPQSPTSKPTDDARQRQPTHLSEWSV